MSSTPRSTVDSYGYERLWTRPYAPPLTWNDILDAELALIRGEPVATATVEKLLAVVKARHNN